MVKKIIPAFYLCSHLFAAFGLSIAPDAVETLNNRLLLPNREAAETAIIQFKQTIKNQKKQNSRTINKAFTEMLTAWAAVQVFYLTETADNQLIDNLLLSYQTDDKFSGKQYQQAKKHGDFMRLLLAEKQQVFYRHEDVQYLLLILHSHLEQQVRLQQAERLTFAYHDKTNGKQSKIRNLQYLLNNLANNTKQLSHWQIGEAMGLSKKDKEAVPKKLPTYLTRRHSLRIATTMLTTQEQAMRILAPVMSRSANNETAAALALIARAKSQLIVFKNEKNKNTAENHFKALLRTLKELHQVYLSLVQVFSVQATILDAEGD